MFYLQTTRTCETTRKDKNGFRLTLVFEFLEKALACWLTRRGSFLLFIPRSKDEERFQNSCHLYHIIIVQFNPGIEREI